MSAIGTSRRFTATHHLGAIGEKRTCHGHRDTSRIDPEADFSEGSLLIARRKDRHVFNHNVVLHGVVKVDERSNGAWLDNGFVDR
jgi:hypothetical protein